MQFLLNGIHHKASLSQVSFHCISILENGIADCLAKQRVCLAKQGADRQCNLSANVCKLELFFSIHYYTNTLLDLYFDSVFANYSWL